MVTKKQWDAKVVAMNQKLFSLYSRGEFSLSRLYEFRELVKEMDYLMQRMFNDIRYSLGSSKVRKDIRRLNNEYLVFEYNLSLLSSVA